MNKIIANIKEKLKIAVFNKNNTQKNQLQKQIYKNEELLKNHLIEAHISKQYYRQRVFQSVNTFKWIMYLYKKALFGFEEPQKLGISVEEAQKWKKIYWFLFKMYSKNFQLAISIDFQQVTTTRK